MSEYSRWWNCDIVEFLSDRLDPFRPIVLSEEHFDALLAELDKPAEFSEKFAEAIRRAEELDEEE